VLQSNKAIVEYSPPTHQDIDSWLSSVQAVKDFISGSRIVINKAKRLRCLWNTAVCFCQQVCRAGCKMKLILFFPLRVEQISVTLINSHFETESFQIKHDLIYLYKMAIQIILTTSRNLNFN